LKRKKGKNEGVYSRERGTRGEGRGKGRSEDLLAVVFNNFSPSKIYSSSIGREKAKKKSFFVRGEGRGKRKKDKENKTLRNWVIKKHISCKVGEELLTHAGVVK